MSAEASSSAEDLGSLPRSPLHTLDTVPLFWFISSDPSSAKKGPLRAPDPWSGGALIPPGSGRNAGFPQAAEKAKLPGGRGPLGVLPFPSARVTRGATGFCQRLCGEFGSQIRIHQGGFTTAARKPRRILRKAREESRGAGAIFYFFAPFFSRCTPWLPGEFPALMERNSRTASLRGRGPRACRSAERREFAGAVRPCGSGFRPGRGGFFQRAEAEAASTGGKFSRFLALERSCSSGGLGL